MNEYMDVLLTRTISYDFGSMDQFAPGSDSLGNTRGMEFLGTSSERWCICQRFPEKPFGRLAGQLSLRTPLHRLAALLRLWRGGPIGFALPYARRESLQMPANISLACSPPSIHRGWGCSSCLPISSRILQMPQLCLCLFHPSVQSNLFVLTSQQLPRRARKPGLGNQSFGFSPVAMMSARVEGWGKSIHGHPVCFVLLNCPCLFIPRIYCYDKRNTTALHPHSVPLPPATIFFL